MQNTVHVSAKCIFFTQSIISLPERENLFALLRSAMKHRKSSGGKDAKLLIDVLQASGQPEAVQLADALRHCVCGFHHIGTCKYYR